MADIGKLWATLGVNTAGLDDANSAFRRFEKNARNRVNRVNRTLRSLGRTLKQTGRMMTTYLTLPLGAAGVAAVKMHMEFEASMAKVVGLVGVAKKTVDGWAESVKRLAPAVGRSPKELGDALYFITSAGIRSSESMEVLEYSAKASAAGLGETKLVADLVTSAMNAYGKANLSAASATDILTETVREGKSEATLLATTMGMVLPIAAELGVSFNQVGAGMAAMTRTGTTSATAAMQLRQMLNSILKPAKQAEESLYAMGTSSEALRNTLRGPGLLQALMDIRDLTNVYGEEIMATVFPNIRALSGVLDIMGKNLGNNIRIFDNLNNATGRLDKAFGAAADTTKFKLAQAMQEINRGMTELGESMKEYLVPAFKVVGEWVKSLTDWYLDLDTSQQKLILSIVGIVFVLGPLLTVLGFIIGNIIPMFLTGLGSITTAIAVLTKVMWANPILAFGMALGSVVTWLIRHQSAAERATRKQKEFNDELEEATRLAKLAAKTQYRDIFKTMDLTKTEERTARGTQVVHPPILQFWKKDKEIPLVFKVEVLDVDKLNNIGRFLNEMSVDFLQNMKKQTEDAVKQMESDIALLEGYQRLADKGMYDMPTESAIVLKQLIKDLPVVKQLYADISEEMKDVDKLAEQMAKDWAKTDEAAPNFIELTRAVRMFKDSMENVDTTLSYGLKGFDEAENKFKTFQTALMLLIEYGGKDMPDGLAKWIRDVTDMGDDVEMSMEWFVKMTNYWYTMAEKSKSLKAATDVLEEFNNELAFLEAKKLIFPDFDFYNAYIKLLENTTDELIHLKVAGKLTGKQLTELGKMVTTLFDMKQGGGFLTYTMDQLEKSLKAVDDAVNTTMDISKVNVDKTKILKTAILNLKDAFGDNFPVVLSLTDMYVAYGGSLDDLKNPIVNAENNQKRLNKAMLDMRSKLKGIEATGALFDKLAQNKGFSTTRQYLLSIGEEFDVTEEKMKILNQTLTSLGALEWLPTVDLMAAFEEITNGMDLLGKSATRMRADFFTNFDKILSAASSFVTDMGGLIEANKQRELSAAGDNAARREAIEKKYHEQQKKWAIANVIINMAVGISKVWAEAGANMVLAAALTAAHVVSGGLQIAAIQAQSFASGAVVYGETYARVGEYAGARNNPEIIAPLDRLVSILRAELFGGTQADYGQKELEGFNKRMIAGFRKRERKYDRVVFEIEGDKLKGVLDSYDNQLSNF